MLTCTGFGVPKPYKIEINTITGSTMKRIAPNSQAELKISVSADIQQATCTVWSSIAKYSSHISINESADQAKIKTHQTSFIVIAICLAAITLVSITSFIFTTLMYDTNICRKTQT